METSKLVLNDRVYPSVADRAREYTQIHVNSRATVSLEFVMALNFNHRQSASGYAKLEVFCNHTQVLYTQQTAQDQFSGLAHGKDVTQSFIALWLFALSLS